AGRGPDALPQRAATARDRPDRAASLRSDGAGDEEPAVHARRPVQPEHPRWSRATRGRGRGVRLPTDERHRDPSPHAPAGPRDEGLGEARRRIEADTHPNRRLGIYFEWII